MNKKLSEGQILSLLLMALVYGLLLWLVFSGVFDIGLLIGIGIAKLIMYVFRRDTSKTTDDSPKGTGNSGTSGWYYLLILVPLLVVLFLLYSATGLTPAEALGSFGLIFLKVLLFNLLLFVGLEALKAFIDDSFS